MRIPRALTSGLAGIVALGMAACAPHEEAKPHVLRGTADFSSAVLSKEPIGYLEGQIPFKFVGGIADGRTDTLNVLVFSGKEYLRAAQDSLNAHPDRVLTLNGSDYGREYRVLLQGITHEDSTGTHELIGPADKETIKQRANSGY